MLLPKKTTINCNGKLLDLSRPQVMGIVNLTPDSFYEGSRFATEEVVAQVAQMLKRGAAIVDIGAYSSRPGAGHISAEEEWARLSPALASIRNEFSEVIISVDTFRAEIARKAVEEFNVDIINDISAGEMDCEMFDTIADLQVPYVIMHMQGTPQTMQQTTNYSDLMRDLVQFFADKVETLKRLAVHDVIIDPGFGFGKTLDQNYDLLAHLGQFSVFEQPVLIGISRKSMIYKLLGNTPEEGLNGTTALHMVALQKGAKILRVHDVEEAVECIALFEKIQNA